MYSRVVTNKTVNIYQLRIEAETPLLWDSPTSDGKMEIHGEIEEEKLAQVVGSHVAQPILLEPSVQDQFDALTDKLMSKGLISAAEVAQFKAKKPPKPR